MQTGNNVCIGQLGNRGTEGLTDFLKVKHIEMHKKGKTEALATNTAAAQIPTRHTDSPFQPSSIFPNVRVGHEILA